MYINYSKLFTYNVNIVILKISKISISTDGEL